MSTPEIHTAHCSCGALQANVAGEPDFAFMCSCEQCQRRTGSAFGLVCYWPEEKVEVSGKSTAWSRTAETGGEISQNFCPICGSVIWWRTELFQNKIGVAGGAFADPDFIKPRRAIWDDHRHTWLVELSSLKRSRTQPGLPTRAGMQS